MALVMRNFKKFMKKKFHKKDGYDKKKPNHRRCYECKESGHYIADCPRQEKKMKRRNTRRRARTSRKDIKVVLMLVKSGSQAMKNPTRKVWHHLP